MATKLFYVTKRSYKPPKGKVFEMESKTIPGQSMSIRTVLERFARGIPPTGNPKTPVYNGDVQIPDLTKMDFADREAYIIAHREKIEQLQDQVKVMQKAIVDKKRADKEAEYLHKAEEAVRNKREPELKPEQKH